MSVKMDFKIGDKIFVFDQNRRVYGQKKSGELYSSGRPIFREHFVEKTIDSETSRSWIIGKDWSAIKCPKARLAKSTDGRFAFPRFYTAEEVEDAVFADAHAYRIGERVQKMSGPALKEIARLAGYDYEKEAGR